jgi:hypothetical protein
MNRNFKLNIFILLLTLSFIACSESNGAIDEKPVYLNLSENKLNFGRIGDTQTVTVETNAEEVTTSVSADTWCTVTYTNGTLSVSTNTNPNSEARAATIAVQAGEIKKTISVMQQGRNSGTDEIKDDIKIPVKNGTASSAQSGEGIEKSFDGDLSTIYHSKWDNSAANYFPITLSYNFENVPSMDYIVYNPRTDGRNGLFKEFDLYVATAEHPELAKYGSYDFKGSSSASRITFSQAIVNPTQIQFVIKSGVGDGQGFASCAEMEFYRKNPDNFDYLTIFTDNTCSQLKSGIGEAQIRAISNQFFRDLAYEIYKGEYDNEFRVQSYQSWQHPDIMAKINKTGTYGLRDNPTGIYAGPGEDIIVFVGDTHKQNISLFIQDPNNKISGSSYPLTTGMNKIKAANTGLMYIMYYTETGTEPSVKINIATGTVNGYFDSRKHKKEDWKRLLDKATFRHFDVIGQYASMTFETEAFREYTPDGLGLINQYDKLVSMEQEFMGLFDYNKAYKNHAYFLVINDSYMYATSYYTAFNAGTQSSILDYQKFTTTDACWGPAHELGHVHQTRPGLRWIGMTEVTNNIHSLYIQTSWGVTSRLITDKVYDKAFKNLLNKGIPHNEGSDVWVKLVPFWQLKLYMMDVLGKKDFYKNIYEAIRNQPEVDTSKLTDGYYQLNFVKLACQSANLDLTSFFEAWGFLTPADITIDDYSTQKFTITQEQIDRVKAEIAAKKYPKPKHNNIFDIRDDNVDSFK